MTLQPGNNFSIVRQIPNHTDTATYFVRAVIRNAYTDAIIETLDLTDKGSQRFSKNWQVPQDSSGQGFYISIVTSVYTDSGYTTKSDNYGDDENTYLIQDRIAMLGGRGGGVGVDYERVRRIVREEVAKVDRWKDILTSLEAISEKIQPPEKTNLEPVLIAIEETKAKIRPPEKVKFAPVLAKIDEAIAVIREKEVTPATDLTPVLDRLASDKEDIEVNLKGLKESVEEVGGGIKTELASSTQELKKDLEGKSFITSFSPVAPKENRKLDIKRLAS